MRGKKEIGDFVIAVDDYGPVLTRKESDQECFEFVDAHEAPDAAHEEMLAAAEELQAEYLKELLTPRVEIVSLEALVKALKQTGGVIFPGDEPNVYCMPDLSAYSPHRDRDAPVSDTDSGSSAALSGDGLDVGDEPSLETSDATVIDKPVYPQEPPELDEPEQSGAAIELDGDGTETRAHRQAFRNVSKALGKTLGKKVGTSDEPADMIAEGKLRDRAGDPDTGSIGKEHAWLDAVLSQSFNPESYFEVAIAYQAMMRARKTRLGRPPISLSNEYLSSDEAIRAQRLRALYEDPRGTDRPLIIADDAMIARIEAVGRLSPQFEGLIGLYIRAARLSALTRTAFHVPPLVLVGPPGTGKSFTAQRLAAAIHGGKDFHRLSMNLISDSGMLFGHEQSWRGSKPGILTNALVESETASPVLFMDEIDKLQSTSSSHEDPFIPFLTLLEPENAKMARDTYLGLDFDLSHVLVIATANDISGLSGPIKDRFLVLETKPPTLDQRMQIIRNMLAESAKAYRGQILQPDKTVIEALAQHHPRRMTKVIGLALGYMAAEGRLALSLDDVAAAATLLEPAEKPGIGFMAAII